MMTEPDTAPPERPGALGTIAAGQMTNRGTHRTIVKRRENGGLDAAADRRDPAGSP